MKVSFAAMAAVVVLMQAQQPPPPAAGAAQPPRAPAPKPFIPVAANTLASAPDAHAGNMVSVTATVAERFGATAFSVQQGGGKGTGQDVLVLAPVLNAPVEPGAYVTVIGEVVKFDPGAVATRMKDATPTLSPDVASRYQGRAAIIATSVINAAMMDLAKRIPPPMSPEELALSKLMKQIGPGFNALRQAATAGSDAAEAGAQAAALKKAFTETATFWKGKPHPDAIQWNEDARTAADAIAAAAGRADWDAIKTSMPRLQGACASCHNQYRERLDDGTYRFKPPAR
jgi:cytochrome c556